MINTGKCQNASQYFKQEEIITSHKCIEIISYVKNENKLIALLQVSVFSGRVNIWVVLHMSGMVVQVLK